MIATKVEELKQEIQQAQIMVERAGSEKAKTDRTKHLNRLKKELRMFYIIRGE